MAGLSVKKELIDETSAVRQLASDEVPTVCIKDTPPVPRPVGRCGPEGRVSAPRRIGGRDEQTITIVHGHDKSGSILSLSRVYFPVFTWRREKESGTFTIAGGASRGRMNSMKGGFVVMFEAPQLTVNGPHCVVGECNGVKPLEVRKERRRRIRSDACPTPTTGAIRATLLGWVCVRSSQEARRLS